MQIPIADRPDGTPCPVWQKQLFCSTGNRTRFPPRAPGRRKVHRVHSAPDRRTQGHLRLYGCVSAAPGLILMSAQRTPVAGIGQNARTGPSAPIGRSTDNAGQPQPLLPPLMPATRARSQQGHTPATVCMSRDRKPTATNPGSTRSSLKAAPRHGPALFPVADPHHENRDVVGFADLGRHSRVAEPLRDRPLDRGLEHRVHELIGVRRLP